MGLVFKELKIYLERKLWVIKSYKHLKIENVTKIKKVRGSFHKETMLEISSELFQIILE
jgi:hypothetical protein